MADPSSKRNKPITNPVGTPPPESSTGVAKSSVLFGDTTVIGEDEDLLLIDMLDWKPEDDDNDNDNTHAGD